MPCNLNQRELAQDVKHGIREAGGTPMEFNTIAVSDGVSMGTTGHARIARLARGDRGLDRDRRARSSVRRTRLPGRVRQDEPGRRDGARPARHPGPRPLHGLDRAGPASAAARSRSQDVYEGIGAHAAGRSAPTTCTSSSPSPARAQAPAAASSPPTRCRRPRVPRHQPAGRNGDPGADHRRRPRLPSSAAGSSSISCAATCARRRSSRARRSRTPRHPSSRPAARRTASSICSRSRYEFGIPFTIDDFDEIAERTPVLADMKPWGRYHATDVYRAGGVALVARELKKASSCTPARRRSTARRSARSATRPSRPKVRT